MAETNDKNQETSSVASKGRKLMPLLMIGGICLAEGAGIFFLTKMMYKQPESANAAPPTAEERSLEQATKEVELCLPEVNAFNKREGRLFLYTLEITIRVDKEKEAEIQQIVDARKSTILDRFNTVIRSADTKYLNEPGLDTLRRQLKFELERILGSDELVLELLIPKFYQAPANL